MERYDIILLFGVPLNRSAAEIVIRKSKMLLRPGGQACIFDPVFFAFIGDFPEISWRFPLFNST